MSRWSVRQFSDVVDAFRRGCPAGAWDAVMLKYSMLVQKGPLCGPSVAKKLQGGKGIWELIARDGTIQPRLLFYFDERLIVFVHAFIKQGNKDYKRAIPLAQSRRGLITRQERQTSVIETFKSTLIH